MEQEVVDFCKAYLAVNKKAFCDPRLEIIINDARSYCKLNNFSRFFFLSLTRGRRVKIIMVFMQEGDRKQERML